MLSLPRDVLAPHPRQDFHLGATRHNCLLRPRLGRARRPRPLLRPPSGIVRRGGASDLVRSLSLPLYYFPGDFVMANEPLRLAYVWL